MPHQWLEGNLPVSAKCAVCDKTCGSVLRLQDWRCLWCKAMVRHLSYGSIVNVSFIPNNNMATIRTLANIKTKATISIPTDPRQSGLSLKDSINTQLYHYFGRS